MSSIDAGTIRIAAEDEGRRLARLTFEGRGNKGTVHVTEKQLSGHIAVAFESGAYWTLKRLTHK